MRDVTRCCAVLIGVNSDEYDAEHGMCLTRLSKPNTDEVWVQPGKSKVPIVLEDRVFGLGDIVQRANSDNIEVGRVCDVMTLCSVRSLRNNQIINTVPSQCLSDACPVEVGTPVEPDLLVVRLPSVANRI